MIEELRKEHYNQKIAKRKFDFDNVGQNSYLPHATLYYKTEVVPTDNKSCGFNSTSSLMKQPASLFQILNPLIYQFISL
jgi:hypothetical protein